MLQKLRKNKEGFTLIELMIVIAIIGILAAIAIPNFISYRNKAYCSATENDAHAIAAALADYYAIPGNNTVPSVAGLGVTVSDGNTGVITGPMNTIVITVQDGSSRCPAAYQSGATGWNANVFTLNMQ
jgi:prepilin-type N-terminal cleavage/methylation domain-containing protein